MKHRKIAWWQLYSLVPIMIGLLLAEHLVPLNNLSAEIVDVGIVILTFSLMFGWVHINAGRLEEYYDHRDNSLNDLKITVYEPAVKRLDDRPEQSEWVLPTTLPAPSFIRTKQFTKLEEIEK